MRSKRKFRARGRERGWRRNHGTMIIIIKQQKIASIRLRELNFTFFFLFYYFLAVNGSNENWHNGNSMCVCNTFFRVRDWVIIKVIIFELIVLVQSPSICSHLKDTWVIFGCSSAVIKWRLAKMIIWWWWGRRAMIVT